MLQKAFNPMQHLKGNNWNACRHVHYAYCRNYSPKTRCRPFFMWPHQFAIIRTLQVYQKGPYLVFCLKWRLYVIPKNIQWKPNDYLYLIYLGACSKSETLWYFRFLCDSLTLNNFWRSNNWNFLIDIFLALIKSNIYD